MGIILLKETGGLQSTPLFNTHTHTHTEKHTVEGCSQNRKL